MQQYLAPVLRYQFNLFYRFSYIFIPKDHLIELDADISDRTKDRIVDLFSRLTPFEYDEEYLILRLEKPTASSDSSVQFNIEDVVQIYPLSSQAKASIESKIDSRIRLSDPIFENVLERVESKIQEKEILNAIEGLWKICEFEGDSRNYVEQIGFDNIMTGLDAREKGLKAKAISNGNYWNYVIAYDRADYFPNTILGYFFDAGQIFAFSKGLETFEGSSLYVFLQQLNNSQPSIKFRDVILKLQASNEVKGYISQTDGVVKKYIVTPLYSMLKEELRKVEDFSESILIKSLPYLKEEFSESFKHAVILLGAFFGFRKFYDTYYDRLSLKFYKHSSIAPSIKEENEVNIPNVVSPLNSEDINNLVTLKPAEAHCVKTLDTTKEVSNNATALESNPLLFSAEPTTLAGNEKYMVIILEALDINREVTLKDLRTLIKQRIGKGFTSNKPIKEIIGGMKDVEVFSKSGSDAARFIRSND